jgi:hypothetical protein
MRRLSMSVGGRKNFAENITMASKRYLMPYLFACSTAAFGGSAAAPKPIRPIWDIQVDHMLTKASQSWTPGPEEFKLPQLGPLACTLTSEKISEDAEGVTYSRGLVCNIHKSYISATNLKCHYYKKDNYLRGAMVEWVGMEPANAQDAYWFTIICQKNPLEMSSGASHL